MNQGQINGFAMGAGASGGSNALLQGGFASAGLLSSLLVASALLTGGLFTESDTKGRVSHFLAGGVAADSVVGGKQFYTANLQQGIFSGGQVSANLGRAPGLNGGVESGNDTSGQVLASARLQSADTVGDTSTVGGALAQGAVLNDGLYGTSYASALLVGSVVLVADGLNSGSELGGWLDNGFTLSGGAESTGTLGAGYFIPALLQDGIQSTHDTGHEIDISPVLMDGVISVNTVGSPVLRVSPALNSGIASDHDFVAQIILSPQSNDGIEATATLGGLWRVDARVTGGVDSTSLTDSVNLVAAQKLRGGIQSTGVVFALLGSSPHLDGGVFTSAFLSVQLRASARLRSGLDGSGMTDGALRASPRLQGGTDSTSALDGAIATAIYLRDGADSADAADAQYRLGAVLANGCDSGSISSGAFKAFAILHSGADSAGAVSATPIRISALLPSQPLTSSSLLDGALAASATLPSAAFLSLCEVGGHLLAIPHLTDGVSSGGLLSGDIVQGFLDPLLNNRALSIESATPVFSIETPQEDI